MVDVVICACWHQNIGTLADARLELIYYTMAKHAIPPVSVSIRLSSYFFALGRNTTVVTGYVLYLSEMFFAYVFNSQLSIFLSTKKYEFQNGVSLVVFLSIGAYLCTPTFCLNGGECINKTSRRYTIRRCM